MTAPAPGAASPASARIEALADDLRRLAHHAAAHDPQLGSALILCAVRAGFIAVAAHGTERDLRAARRTITEMHAQAAEDADRAEAQARAADPTRAARWHGRARTIAAILEPVLRHPGQPQPPEAA